MGFIETANILHKHSTSLMNIIFLLLFAACEAYCTEVLRRFLCILILEQIEFRCATSLAANVGVNEPMIDVR